MEVFLIPLGQDRYELYCEPTEELDTEEPPHRGIFGGLRRRFNVMLHAAEARQGSTFDPTDATRGWARRLQDRLVGWVAERVAEQRLLWNLRRQTTVQVMHPEDMVAEEAVDLVRQSLRRDYERHRRWLVFDTAGLVVSGLVAIVPGPNVLAYFFAFRVVGHWLSMQGARRGIRKIVWTASACPPLSELRRAATLHPDLRASRVCEIAERLRLPRLPVFLERIAFIRA